jgi:hypothetical protein
MIVSEANISAQAVRVKKWADSVGFASKGSQVYPRGFDFSLPGMDPLRVDLSATNPDSFMEVTVHAILTYGGMASETATFNEFVNFLNGGK